MIKRKNYRACLLQDNYAELLQKDKPVVEDWIRKGRCLTVAMYIHENMLFLYMEEVQNVEEELTPGNVFPHLSETLAMWPEKSGMTPWAYMYPIYYHDIPKNEEQWSRQGKKKRRGRIAYLHEDKMFSYTYYHKAIVDEGLLEGDRYQFIALHEDILFSYFEEPKIFTHIRKECQEESKVIKDWLAQDPESHFDHELSGADNFLLLDEVFSLGREDI